MAVSTVPVTVVQRTVIQEPVCLAHRNSQKLRVLRSLTIPFSLALFILSQFLPLLLYYFTVRT